MYSSIPRQYGLPLIFIVRVRPRPWPTWHELSEAFLWCWQYPNEAAALIPLGGGLHGGNVCPDSGQIAGIQWTRTTTPATVARRHGTPHMEDSEAVAGGEAGVDWWLGFTTFVTVVTFTGNFW